MRVTWLGHGSFRIEIGGQILLLDPWFTGNPAFPEGQKEEACQLVTHLLITHGHHDHTADCAALSKAHGVPMIGMYELINHFAGDGIEGIGANKGGRVMCGDVSVTLVAASHSSTAPGESGAIPTGSEIGFMIEHGGRCLYAMGDTDIMADWAWMAELHKPDVAIVPIGGHFTMDGARAAWGVRKFFPDLGAAIPGHYKTFPLLEQSADAFVAGMAPVAVHVPEVMGTVEL